jgi:hypothetical protein
MSIGGASLGGSTMWAKRVAWSRRRLWQVVLARELPLMRHRHGNPPLKSGSLRVK